ncbi:MAG TPA: Ig-like domain-containing protein [Myxococcaceae bacterium]|jgi:hypothetical protein
MTTRFLLLLVVALAAACGDDPKPNVPPTLSDVRVSTDEDTPAVIAVSPEDADGDTLEVTFTAPSHGTLEGTGTTVTYTPRANFTGEETFEVTVSDGKASAVATVTVTVNPVNDSPVAANDTVAMDEDVLLTLAARTLLANDSDVDSQPLTITAVQNSSHGTATLSGTAITFRPSADFNGEAAFEYVVTDGQTHSIGLVTVTVNPENDGPVATPVTVTAAHNTATDITLTVTDLEGDALTFTTTTPAHGTLSGTGARRTYIPEAGFSGQDRFTFEASDGRLVSNTATVSITVNPPPGPPPP